jgi:hypothetical protein
MAKKARSQETTASGKSAASKATPAKATSPKSKTSASKSSKTSTAKSAVNKVRRSKGPKIVAGEETRVEAAVAALTPAEPVAETSAPSLEQRYGSFEEARSATLDTLLASIEQAEQLMIVAKRATTFAELEQAVSPRHD